ncbi:SDR family oxidoreductase [Streptomyces sp. NPDC002851]
MATILVTGGTGTLGTLVVDRLRADGHEVRSLSRHSPTYPVDLISGTGLHRAVAGTDAVVHCATTPRGGDEKAARQVIDAVREAGVPHLVYISIVGVDEVPLGYYRTKRNVERLLETSDIGWTVLRTTQFHELAHTLVRYLAKLPVLPLPTGVRMQPIAATEVADRLAALALGEPSGRVPDLGGPEVLTLRDLATAYLTAVGKRRPMVNVRLAGKVYAALRAGGNLTPERALGKIRFADFLAEG